MAPDKFSGLIFLSEKKFRFEKFFIPYVPPQGFFPEKDSEFIAKFEECFPLGVVTAPQKIAALIFYHLKVSRHKRRRDSSPELRMTVVTVVAYQTKFPAVEKKLGSPGLNGADPDIAGFFISPQNHPETVESRRFRRPEFEFRNIEEKYSLEIF